MCSFKILCSRAVDSSGSFLTQVIATRKKHELMRWKRHYCYYRTPITNATTLNIRPQLFRHGATAPSAPGPQNYRGFTITLRHSTLGSTPMEKRSGRHRYIYLKTHNTDKIYIYICVTQAAFKPAIPASERPQIHALDREATVISLKPQ